MYDETKLEKVLELVCKWRSTLHILYTQSYKIEKLHFQGVVTAAVSLIETLAKKTPDEYKGCVSLAVSRLSRVRLCHAIH